MKSNHLLLVPVMFLAILLLTAFSGNNTRYPGGSPAGYTGSPGDGHDCTVCHGGSSSTVDNWITSDIPITGYIAGETYSITVTVSGSGDKGFLVSPQDMEGNILGTLASGSGSKLVGSGGYVTQTNSSSSNPKVWSFSWIAPEQGTGELTFYGAFTVNKPVTKLSTLTVTENYNVSLDENNAIQFSVYPNPASEKLIFSGTIDVSSDVCIRLLDMTGKCIETICDKQVDAGLFNHTYLFGNSLPKGLYLVETSMNARRSIQKVIIR